eukprot:gene32003-10458_t
MLRAGWAARSAADAARCQRRWAAGVVGRFNCRYGFITPDDGNSREDDVFVHTRVSFGVQKRE